MDPAVLAISAEEYHSDGCDPDVPSLSASIAHILVTSSPKHAWTAHPRLNPAFQRRDEDRFDIGRAAHALLLEHSTEVLVVDADSWRTNAAQALREEARETGALALLAKHWAEVQAMIAATRQQLAAVNADPPLFTDGKAEQCLVWEEDGVLCRARLDWLRDDLRAVDDFKTTSKSANPGTWSRTLFDIGADIQVAFYLRGVCALSGKFVPSDFRFAIQETAPPYALSVVSLAPAALELANDKVDHAVATWKRCLERDEWPAYPSRVAFAEPPPWEIARWLEREEAVA